MSRSVHTSPGVSIREIQPLFKTQFLFKNSPISKRDLAINFYPDLYTDKYSIFIYVYLRMYVQYVYINEMSIVTRSKNESSIKIELSPILRNMHVWNLFYVVPDQVTAVTLTRTVTTNQPSLNVSWTALQSDRTIQYYQVDYRVSGSTTWSRVSPNPTTTSTTLENLQLGTTYEVRVRAVSDVGSGTWSDTISETTYNSE